MKNAENKGQTVKKDENKETQSVKAGTAKNGQPAKKEVTKACQRIPTSFINGETLDKLVIDVKLPRLEQAFVRLYEEIKQILDKNRDNGEWLKSTNKALYYIPQEKVFVPDLKRWKLQHDSYSLEMDGLKGERIEADLTRKLFLQQKEKNPLIDSYGTVMYMGVNGNSYKASYIFCYYGRDNCFYISSGSSYNRYESYEDILKLPVHFCKEDDAEYLIKNNINIFGDEEKNQFFEICCSLLEKNWLTYEKHGESIQCSVLSDKRIEIVNAIKEVKQLFGISFVDDDIKKDILALKCTFSSVGEQEIMECLLECDKRRMNMEKYPSTILLDPESGHWDLWDIDEENSIPINASLVARNPVIDALNNKSGVIGIDFGTKSTVVTYRKSRADILPMRVGSGQYMRTISRNDYENPTVMELRNLKKFLEDYKSGNGRPETCWEDVLISHEAAQQLKSEQSKGDIFSSFFSELKQWASDKERQVKIRDQKGYEIPVPAYMDLKEGDFDPIEIYAYYLGMFVNNMFQKIYLRYKLSFPATAEKAVREKILKSFERGIKKSLPQPVLEDEECMRLFKVEQGVSEPAAYAMCALQAYGFDPEEEDKYYYGIFDFGGGTTDFDFGVWTCEEKEPENYDYQISHFGQGGDPYLGGENLLEFLAYDVFISNSQKLLKDEIVFSKPHGAMDVLGCEMLVDNYSQAAHMNTKRMVEKLRGVWEQDEEVRKEVKDGTIQLTLLNREGESNPNYAVNVSLERLDSILEEHIEKGVQHFFNAMKESFDPEHINEIGDVDCIHIFLAGNSSKSPIVTKLLKKYIDITNEGIAKKGKESEASEYIKVYPPLGTVQAEKIQNGQLEPTIDAIIADQIGKTATKAEETKDKKTKTAATPVEEVSPQNPEESNQKLSNDICESIKKPTGKTGVAFGLLDNRVRVVQKEDEEIRFKYYLGWNRKKKFQCVIDRNQPYKVWKRFCTASVSEFDIWFTQLPKASTNAMPINELGVYSEPGFIDEPDEEKSVYIRLIAPTVIEYVVATEEEIANDSYDVDTIQKIMLQEKL